MPAWQNWISGAGFMPHGHCYLWDPPLVWLEVAANGLVALAYLSISITLFYIVRKVNDIPFQWMYVAFGVFIVTCGMTHAFDVLVIWQPAYWPDAAVRAVTAVASVGTAVLLPPLVPKAVALADAASLAHRRGVELETANRELGVLLDRAREIEQLKTDFFANVSHELRTPLTLILGPTEKVLAGGRLSSSDTRELEIVRRNARLLLKHVEDLLEVARLDSGRSEPKYASVDLSSIVRAAASLFESLAADRAVEFAVECSARVQAEVDPDQLQRVIVNLLSNAFKFTPAGGKVRCAVRALGAAAESSDPPGERVAIEVADSGPGIPAAHRARVFERFRQLEGGSARRHGGTGLGLAIARELVELHRGGIEVDQAPEGGALLRVVLPARAPLDAPVHAGPASEGAVSLSALRQAEAELSSHSSSSFELEGRGASASRRPAGSEAAGVDEGGEAEGAATGEGAGAPADAERDLCPLVLVVEDHPEMNHLIRAALEGEFRTEAAYDGASALELARAVRPDAIVCDLMMPGVSGEDLVRELRARGAAADDVPILMLTARADDEQRASLLRQGAQDYLIKPFHADELRARIANWVRASRARRVLSAELATRDSDIERLAREIVRRGRELTAALDSLRVARERAEQASRFKTDFLGMVSHELRTPLTALQLQLEYMRRTAGQRKERGALDTALTRMTTAAGRLASLIDSLLQYARIESGRLVVEVRSIDLERLAGEVVDELRPQAEHKRLELTLESFAPVEIQSDAQLVRLTLANLVSNAIKFTERGAVRVITRATSEEVFVDVTDSGPGIPAEQLARIWEPFEHLEPVASKHTPGFGLGLALVREMVRALGGRIELVSRVGEGSTFTVVLPRCGRVSPPSPAPEGSAMAAGSVGAAGA